MVVFQRKKKEIVFVQNVKALISTSYSTLLLPVMQNMQLTWRRKEHVFQYLLSTIVFHFMEFSDNRCHC